MKTKYNLFTSIFSLAATMLLLVCILLAWYVTNKTVTATGITATTSSGEIWDITLDRYIADENKTDGTYTYDTANNLKEPGVTVNPFDFIAVHDLIVYKITFKTTLENVNVSMRNTVTSRNETFDGKQLAGADTSDTSDDEYMYYNYLSNVANFYSLTASGTGDDVTLTVSKFDASDLEATHKEFTYVGDLDANASPIEEVDLITVTGHDSESSEDYTTVVVYFLFDYDKDNINRLFTANLGTAGANSRVYFREDIEFRLD